MLITYPDLIIMVNMKDILKSDGKPPCLIDSIGLMTRINLEPLEPNKKSLVNLDLHLVDTFCKRPLVFGDCLECPYRNQNDFKFYINHVKIQNFNNKMF